MTNRFMISVAAAALLASSGLAYSQGPAAQQTAPSADRAAPSAAPMNRDSASPAVKGAESDKGTKDGAKAAQSKDSMSKDSPKAAQSKDGMSKDSTTNAQSKDGMTKDNTAQSKDIKTSPTAADTKSGAATTDSKTTGNAATSATAAPPAEKRTQIVSAIRSEKIQETTNVNFNISVGATIPATVRFHPLPPRIVEIYPEWRGYEVILVGGRYIIVRPQTRTIVYIIEA
jgi:Protein of unknown function (DUF1236)